MKFFDIFAITLFTMGGAQAAAIGDGSPGVLPRQSEADRLHGWCQCVVRGVSPPAVDGDPTNRACLAWQSSSGITATYDINAVRCWTIGSRIPGAAFQQACSNQGNFDARCS